MPLPVSPVQLVELPRTVYKYRPLGVKGGEARKNTLGLISEGAAFFSSARNFNDPFDTAIGFDFGEEPEEVFWWVNRYLKDYERDLPKKQRHRKAREIKDEVLAKGTGHLDHVQGLLQKLRYERFGLFCASAVPDDLLMWAHYADNHQGVVLGLSKTVLVRTAQGMAMRHGRIMEALEVKYSGDLVRYPFYSRITMERRKQYLQSVIGTKSDHWAYEREFRLVLWNRTNAVVECGADLVTEVILGCRVTDEAERAVRQALVAEGSKAEGSKAKVFRARKHDERFALVLEPAEDLRSR